LLAYSRGLVSSRKIEQACRENVVFIALACGQQPDQSTIATFVSSMQDEILPLFRDVLLVCEEMNLLGGTMFALEGCKLPSNASKEWTGTFPELQKKKPKIEAKVAQLIVEPVFANIRINKRLDRFTLRGKIEVNIQWLLFCLVHNIEKILNYGMAPA
jgi:hypothetical protein